MGDLGYRLQATGYRLQATGYRDRVPPLPDGSKRELTALDLCSFLASRCSREGTKMRDHRRLKAFALADKLTESVYRHSADFPRSEYFGLRAQIRRAAVSIATNLVEGSARRSQTEYCRFIEIAYASSKELQYELSLCGRLGFLNDEVAGRLDAECTETTRALAGLLQSMRP